jgi:hypothetical protein
LKNFHNEAIIISVKRMNDSDRDNNIRVTLNPEIFISDPELLGVYTPEELYSRLLENGYNIKPLGNGGLRGKPFSEEGGYRISWGGDRYLQYHPAGSGHHDKDAYWKVSDGINGKRRFELDGTVKADKKKRID